MRVQGLRAGWADLPARVQERVEATLGGPVVEARTQSGGFSPGTADRVVTAGGRRAFVKAVHPSLNPVSPSLHRAEAKVTAALPAGVPAPRLLDSFEDDGWVVLVLEDVDGRNPELPWRQGDIDAVLSALDVVRAAEPPAGLLSAADYLAPDLGGWQRVVDDPPADLDPWAADRLPLLAGLAAAGRSALAGESLVHLDVRDDNVLLTDRGAVLVDWAHACVGADWLDTYLLGHAVVVTGGPTGWLDEQLADVADEATAVLAGLTGYFVDISRRPPSPGLPTVRAHQRRWAGASLGWLRERLS